MEVQMTEGQVPAGYMPQSQTAVVPTEGMTALTPRNGEMGTPIHQMGQIDQIAQQQQAQNAIPAAGDAQFYQQQYDQQQKVYEQQQKMQQQQFQNLQQQFQPVAATAAAQQKIIEQKQQVAANPQQQQQINQQYIQQQQAAAAAAQLQQQNTAQTQPNNVIPTNIGNLVVEGMPQGTNFQNMGQLVIDPSSMPMNMKIPNPNAPTPQNVSQTPQMTPNVQSNMAQSGHMQNSAYVNQQNAHNMGGHSNPQTPRQHMTLPHTPQTAPHQMQQPANTYMHQQNLAQQNMMQGHGQMASPRHQQNVTQLSTPYGTAAQPLQQVNHQHQDVVQQTAAQMNQFGQQMANHQHPHQHQHQQQGGQSPIQPQNPQLQQMQNQLVAHQQHYLHHQHAMPQQPYKMVNQPQTPNELRGNPAYNNPYAKPMMLGGKKCNGLQDLDDKRGMWYGS